jgi:murein DD-endopeptidase MepM/ murein hydrolase activator NlpD
MAHPLGTGSRIAQRRFACQFAAAQPWRALCCTFPDQLTKVERVNRTRYLLTVTLAVGIFAGAAALVLLQRRRDDMKPAAVETTPAPALPRVTTESVSIDRGDTLDALLDRAGVDQADKLATIAAARRVFNPRKLRVGSDLNLTRRDGILESLNYIIDSDHELHVVRAEEGFEAEVAAIPGEIRVVPVCGTLQDSLFVSMERTGERAELAMQVADIFAWDIDFYTDPQPGDTFCVVLEKKEYANGQPPAYRRVLAARYVNAGTTYEGYLFADDGGKPGYYSRDGRSLQAAFLRSPLKFDARVSSSFSNRRFHPVLKIYRPHLGTDYAAPVGAPVQAIGSGRVTFAGNSGASGNMVRLRHANGYESMYLHLSRIYVRNGQTVAQGQRVGAVGATGLATGPHLDFRVRRNGTFVNFERMRPPRATKLAGAAMKTFGEESGRLSALMDEKIRSASTLVADGAPAEPAPVE